ncbi:MalM family protein [Parendozoicomonas haliclonae]|uniref:Maltose regulon periplasmic protein n=1 Tax=Parendozoicomonas haliclonae TaxID=1960125 RepID=A0A1X7AKK5_9GAMM|nr:MalM family protein [Parendozoicomonas haliclonae]SMA43986.1 maltose regulon periplasmic protein [Parendozoicomonas haliclonae]
MKRIALAVALLSLVGCSSVSTVTTPSSVSSQPAFAATSFGQLPFQSIELFDKTVELNQMVSQQGTVLMDGQATAVAGWKLPEFGTYRIRVKSQVSRTGLGDDASAFFPEALLLDNNFEVVRKIPASQLKYIDPNLIGEEYIALEYVIDNRDSLQQPIDYLVVMTSAEAKREKVEVANPRVEYAKVRGHVLPAEEVILAEPLEQGEIALEVEPLLSSFVTLQPAAQPQTPKYVPTAIPQQASAELTVTPVQASQLYLKQVQTYIADKDIKSAMALRQNVKELSTKLQAEFSRLYGQNTDVLKVPAINKEQSAERLLTDTFQSHLVFMLKQENPQQALALIDQLDNLTGHIDALF